MEEQETKEKQAKKSTRARASAAGYETLRREAARQLKERLQAGELSTGDLLKVMNMEASQTEKTRPPQGDWVLSMEERG